VSTSIPRYRIWRYVYHFQELATETGYPTDEQVDSLSLTGRTLMNVKGYDPKERFEFGVITSFAYPIEDSGMSFINILGISLMVR